MMGDLFDDLYRRRTSRYGDDIASEHTADAIPDRHGFAYHLATGCRCGACVRGCEAERRKAAVPEYTTGKPKPWRKRAAEIEPAITYDEWKAARSA